MVDFCFFVFVCCCCVNMIVEANRFFFGNIDTNAKDVIQYITT